MFKTNVFARDDRNAAAHRVLLVRFPFTQIEIFLSPCERRRAASRLTEEPSINRRLRFVTLVSFLFSNRSQFARARARAREVFAK